VNDEYLNVRSVSACLRAEFGKGFTYVNLTNMRKFYLQFPNIYALRKELSWTHYRSLIRVENPKAPFGVASRYAGAKSRFLRLATHFVAKQELRF
jgi:hypothetical protein